MIHLIKHFDGDGREVDEDGNPIEDGAKARRVVANREYVSVPLTMMDNAPGMDPREAAWLRYCDRLTNAHKHTKSLTAADAAGDPLTPPAVREGFSGVCPSCGYRASSSDPAPSASAAAYRRYVARLARKSA